MKITLSLPFVALLASLQVSGQVPRPQPKPFQLHELNFIHTSDIHSWYLGQREDKTGLGASIGDVITFVEYLRKTGAPRGQDVIFIDSGDQTHGGGLSDADIPANAKALLLHTSLPYDVLSPGNHELERPEIARHLFEMLEAHPEIKEKYLAANVFYRPPNEPGTERERLGSTHRIWHTESGRKITAIGVMFENQSKTKDAGVFIDEVSTIVNQKWFKEEVLASAPDVFVLVGHMSLSKDKSKWATIHKAIRDRYPYTPIMVFAGHTHERQCILGFNEENPVRSLGIESGRYLETIGWVGLNDPGTFQPLNLSRLHIEANREKLISLTGAVDTVFAQSSDQVMMPFQELYRKFGLGEEFGCLIHDYPWDSKIWDKDDPYHAYNLYRKVAFPAVVPPEGAGPYALLLNDGFMRGPIYSGTFTLNDKFVNTPYDSQAFWSTRIPKAIAERVVEELSKNSSQNPQSVGGVISEGNQRPIVQGRYMRGVAIEELKEDEAKACDAYLGPSPPRKLYWPPKYNATFANGFDEPEACDDVDFVTLEFLKGRAGPAITTLLKQAEDKRCQRPDSDNLLWKQYGTTYSGDVIKDWIKKNTVKKNGRTKCADA